MVDYLYVCRLVFFFVLAVSYRYHSIVFYNYHVYQVICVLSCMLMPRTCHILLLLFVCVHTSAVLLLYKSVCTYAIVAAVIIKIFGSQVKSSRLNSLNYSIVY